MSLKGTVEADTWRVEAITLPGLEQLRFSHAVVRHRIFGSEAAAVLEGLREGMSWIELKSRHAFQV